MTVEPGEVLFEFRRLGNSVKVSAIDPVSNTEISIVGPLGASEVYLKQTALRKLIWVLEKNKAGR